MEQIQDRGGTEMNRGGIDTGQRWNRYGIGWEWIQGC